MIPYEVRRERFLISTDTRRLDRECVWSFLSGTYWARKRPRASMDKALNNSLCFGVYDDAKQVGFARVVTDLATFGYLADVFILESHRKRGLGLWLVQTILSHPDLKGIRRLMLLTQDAHGLYSRLGFVPASHPEHVMEKLSEYPGAEHQDSLG